MRSIWLHVHVPKAGGSTLRQLMNRTFGDGYYNSNSLLETKQYSSAEVSEIIRCHPWLTGFSDHKLSLDLPFDSEHANVHALCFVRDPVERFISRFSFHRNFEEVNCIAQQMTFREFANAELVEKHVHPQTNSQIYFLNGGKANDKIEVIAAAIATRKTCLFPIERFDEACILLENIFPETFTDLSYVRINTSNRKEAIEAADRSFVQDLLADDFALTELANQELDRWLQKAFDTDQRRESALVDFKDRCSRRYHNFRPLRGKDEPLPTEDEKSTDKSTNKPEHLKPKTK